MENKLTIDDLNKLADRWHDLALQGRERAEQAGKNSPISLYERLSADRLDEAAEELRAILVQAQPGDSAEQLIPKLEALYDHWQAQSDESRNASMRSSIDGAKHVGNALGLEKVMVQFREFVQKPS